MMSLDPENYAIRHLNDGVVKLKFPGALWANKYPSASFRVWPKGTYDTDNYSAGAEVYIKPCFAFNSYTLGSMVTATVYGRDGNIPFVSLESGPHVPPLPLELDDARHLQDERTEQAIRLMAAQAVAARAVMYPGQ